jgi:serine phosphatase RsbU (regulator of sigma subunit)
MPRLSWMADTRRDERAALARAAEPPRPVVSARPMPWWRTRPAILVVALAVELAIALPFVLGADPGSVRGIPAPTMLVLAVLASFLLGTELAIVLAVPTSLLAVGFVGEHAISFPVWVALSALMGFAGDRFRAAEDDRRRLQEELQSNLLPPGTALERTPLTIARRYKPAEQRLLLGGDFYALALTPGGDTAVMVGDVSGHGARQAALGVALRAAWRAMTLSGSSNADVLRAMNALVLDEQLRDSRGGELFATVTCIRIAPDSLCAATAGHVAPFVLHAEGVERIEPPPGPPLGAVEEGVWEEVRVPLGREWSLVLYSDGLIEGFAAPGSRERYGSERLASLLESRGTWLLREEDIEALVLDVEAANGGPLADDLVVVALSPALARAEVGSGGSPVRRDESP